MDFFIDNAVKKSIKRIIENNKDKDIIDDTLIWKQLTKCMIRTYGIIPVMEHIETCVEELANADWFENKYPKEIFKEKKERVSYGNERNKLRDLINTKLSIIDVAKNYNLDTDKKGKTTCPFHNDSEPSLILDDKKNIFHCFGCNAKGDLITFIKKMEELKSGDEKRS